MLECHWCHNEYDARAKFVLDYDNPDCGVAHFHIRNELCPDCQEACVHAIAQAELHRRKVAAESRI